MLISSKDSTLISCLVFSFLGEYETYKCVTIKDRSLGYLYYGLVGLIFLYIGIYTIGYCKGYLEYETPGGSVNLRVKHVLMIAYYH